MSPALVVCALRTLDAIIARLDVRTATPTHRQKTDEPTP